MTFYFSQVMSAGNDFLAGVTTLVIIDRTNLVKTQHLGQILSTGLRAEPDNTPV